MKIFYTVTSKASNSYEVKFDGLDETATIEQQQVDEADIYLTALGCFDLYRKTRTPIALNQSAVKYDGYIDLPSSLEAKIYLYNAMLKERKKPADLARLLGISPQRVNKLLTFTITTEIDSIQRALACLGYQLRIEINKVI